MIPAELTATEAASLMASGQLSSVELVESCLERIAAVDPAVNAMVTVADQRARQEASRADQATVAGDRRGPLHGLPIAIKDLQSTEGIRTTLGSGDHLDNIPTTDAGIVARIRAAGGIVIGKTNIPELSIGANTINRVFGATGNPFDPTLTCGGSSGGSAVAVATGMVPLATGSDHGGSLRIPACYCGVVGHRASPGVVPNEQRAVTQTFYSVQGPMARTVPDAALLLSVIAGRSTADPLAFPMDPSVFASLEPVDVGALRVGINEDLGGLGVSLSVRRSFRDRVDAISGVVASCETVPIDLRVAPSVDWRLRSDLFVAQWAEESGQWDAEFNPNIRATYESALATSMEDIARARRTQMMLYQSFREIFESIDVLICPGVSVVPFPWTELNPTSIDGEPVENYMAWLELTSSLTVVGHPVTALPCGLDEQGTPFGIQVVGPMYGDRRLLSSAAALEGALAGSERTGRPRPAVDRLATTVTTCREEGRRVATAAARSRDPGSGRET